MIESPPPSLADPQYLPEESLALVVFQEEVFARGFFITVSGRNGYSLNPPVQNEIEKFRRSSALAPL